MRHQAEQYWSTAFGRATQGHGPGLAAAPQPEMDDIKTCSIDRRIRCGERADTER
jgi:hypothetical protein